MFTQFLMCPESFDGVVCMSVMYANNSFIHMAPPPGATQEADVRNRAEGDEGGEAPPKGE